MTREEAIAIFEDNDTVIENPNYLFTEIGEAWDKAIEALKDRPHGEWIPCSERLPEEDGKYIVCWCGAWGVDICFAEYSKCGKYWYERGGSEYRGITAWMPLPEPYRKGGDEK